MSLRASSFAIRRVLHAAIVLAVAAEATVVAARVKSASELARRMQYAAAKREAAADTASQRGAELHETLLLLARLETEANSAESLYRRVIASGPSREAAEAALELGKIAYARGDYGEAVALLAADNGELPARERDEAAYFRGLSLRQLGDRARARTEFSRVTRDEFAAWSLISMGEIEMEERRIPRAIELFERAVKSDAQPIARFRLGECYEQSGATERALETYRSIASDLPRSLEAARAAEKLSLLAKPRDDRARESVREGGERGGTRSSPGAAAPAADRYTIQFGAFGSRSNALAAARKLEGVVTAIRVESVDMDGRIWHRVRAGVYENRSSAERDLARAREALGISGTVVPLR